MTAQKATVRRLESIVHNTHTELTARALFCMVLPQSSPSYKHAYAYFMRRFCGHISRTSSDVGLDEAGRHVGCSMKEASTEWRSLALPLAPTPRKHLAQDLEQKNCLGAWPNCHSHAKVDGKPSVAVCLCSWYFWRRYCLKLENA